MRVVRRQDDILDGNLQNPICRRASIHSACDPQTIPSRTPINSMKSDCISIVIHWLAVAMLEIVLFFNNGDHIGFPILLIIATATLMLRRIFLRFEFFAEVILTFLPILVFFPLTNDASLNDLLRVEPDCLLLRSLQHGLLPSFPLQLYLAFQPSSIRWRRTMRCTQVADRAFPDSKFFCRDWVIAVVTPETVG